MAPVAEAPMPPPSRLTVATRLERGGGRVAFAAGGGRLVAWSGLWLDVFGDAEHPESLEVPPAASTLGGAPRFDPDGGRVLAGPVALDLATGTWTAAVPLDVALAQDERAELAGWTPDGTELVLLARRTARRGPNALAPPGGASTRLLVLEAATGEPLHALALDDPFDAPTALAVEAGWIVAGGIEPRAWRGAEREPLPPLPPLGATAAALAIDTPTGLLAALDGAGEATTSRPPGTELARWRAHAPGAGALAVPPGGGWLLTGGEDGRVAAWAPDGSLLAELDAGAPVSGLAVAPGAPTLAAGLRDGGVLLLALSAGSRAP